jgi:uncharacterized protein (TIGR02145 family)
MAKKQQILLVFATIICIYSCNSGNNSNKTNEDEFLEIQSNEEIVTDIDGNKYETIKIGKNIWFASNLKATRFSNGDKIPNVKEDEIWKKNNGPAYCFFNNDIKNYDFGCLYNLYTVIDKRNICPKGWHVASNDEWNEGKGNSTSFNLKDKLFNNKILGWRRIQDDVDYYVEGQLNRDPNYNSFFLEDNSKDGGSAIYWTSDKYMDENYDTETAGDSIIRGSIHDSGGLGEYGWGYRKDGFPCRCVKDSL